MTIPRGTDGTSPIFSTLTSTSTLSAGSNATASISGSGTSSNPYIFSFGIPRGDTGSQGPAGNSIPVGTIIIYASNNSVPSGFLLCDGAAISRSTYSSLYSSISTTYGSGNGSTTFNLPNLNNYWIKGSSTAGSSVNAGLPNITGTIGSIFGNASDFVKTGAFSGSGTPPAKSTRATGSTGGPFTANFSASSSNSLYGASTTVSVSSKTVRFIIKY